MISRRLVVLLLLIGSIGKSETTQPASNEAINSNEKDMVPVEGINQELWALFHDWMKDFEREYETEEMKLERMMIWVENNAMITAHNNQKPPPSFLMGHNQFSDLTAREFRQRNFLGEFSPGIVHPSPKLRGSEHEEMAEERRHLDAKDALRDLPEAVDWVKKGAVTPVKNQGMCGSCWAFSAIASIEGRRFIETGQLESLSVQELLDCDLRDNACSGGLMNNAFRFDERSGGICSEADYSYEAKRHRFGGCKRYKSQCDVVPHTEVDTFHNVKHSNLDLKTAIVDQPVSVAIQAGTKGFQFYKSGVYDPETCNARVDHGVLAVGYGVEDNIAYWLIKNSWGKSWGDHGYIKMSVASKNKDDEGQCGILTAASYPILKDNVAPTA